MIKMLENIMGLFAKKGENAVTSKHLYDIEEEEDKETEKIKEETTSDIESKHMKQYLETRNTKLEYEYAHNDDILEPEEEYVLVKKTGKPQEIPAYHYTTLEKLIPNFCPVMYQNKPADVKKADYLARIILEQNLCGKDSN